MSNKPLMIRENGYWFRTPDRYTCELVAGPYAYLWDYHPFYQTTYDLMLSGY